MSVYTGAERIAFAAPQIATEKLRALLLWVIGFAGAFVFIEPSPYEVVGVATIFLFALTGLSLRPGLAPLVLLLILLNVGYGIAVVQVIDQSKSVVWVLISAFLATTAVFYAAMLGANTEARLRWLMRGYMAAAVDSIAHRDRGLFPPFRRRCRIRSCSTSERAPPSTIRTCSALFWCFPACCCSSAS